MFQKRYINRIKGGEFDFRNVHLSQLAEKYNLAVYYAKGVKKNAIVGINNIVTCPYRMKQNPMKYILSSVLIAIS